MSWTDVETGEKQWLTAFNSGDAAGVAAKYVDTARLLPPNMDILDGRPAIEAFIKEFVATGAQLSFKLIDVHDAGSLCASVGKYVLTMPGDAGPQTENGKFVEIWARQPDGSWLIADDIFNSSDPAAG